MPPKLCSHLRSGDSVLLAEQPLLNSHGTKKGASAKRRARRNRAAARAQIVAGKFAAQDACAQEASSDGESVNSNVAEVEHVPDYYASLTEKINAGGEELRTAIAELCHSVLQHSLDANGCRVMQLALEKASKIDAERLTADLHGHVEECMQSPHANYVLQKVVEALPSVHSGFIAAELKGLGLHAARHRFGCRILCRLIEHGSLEAETVALVDELIARANELCRDKYSHYVANSVFEHGSDAQKKQLVLALHMNLFRLAQHRNASQVILEALRHCADEDKHKLAARLLEDSSYVWFLANSQCGHHVLKALLRLGGEYAQIVQNHLRQHDADPSQMTKYGRRVLADLGFGSVIF